MQPQHLEIMVAEGFPIKQGLKLYDPEQLCDLLEVAEGFPIKQGLKQLTQSPPKRSNRVAEGFPIKQGLKLINKKSIFLSVFLLQKDFQ